MRRRGVIEYKAAMRVWNKLGITPISDFGNTAVRQRRLLAGFSAPERELMLQTTEESEPKAALLKLKEMHPGVRELRMRNYINSFYSGEGWEENVERYEKAHEAIYEKVGLRKPSPGEKLEAVKNVANLNENQIEALTTGSVDKIENPWTKRRALEIVASLALKLRTSAEKKEFHVDEFVSKLDYEEIEMLKYIGPEVYGRKDEGAKQALLKLNNDLKEKLDRDNPMKPVHYVTKRIKGMSGLNIESLRKKLAVKKDYDTLCEFLGVKQENSSVVFRKERILTQAKNDKNGDSALSADIVYEDGNKARLDAVFDGVGFSKKPDEASNLAAEIFKMAMLLDPPRNATDIKLIMTITDLAIAKDYCTAGELNTASTTAVVTLVQDGMLTAVHAGDSRWMVFRNGGLLAMSRDHVYGGGKMVLSVLGSVFDYVEASHLELQNGDYLLLCSDGVSDVVCHHEMAAMLSEKGSGAAEDIMETAKERDTRKLLFETRCECRTIRGKKDDRTMIISAVEGMEEPEIIEIGFDEKEETVMGLGVPQNIEIDFGVQERESSESLNLSFGRNRMGELAEKLGVEQRILETALIDVVRMMKGTYDPLISVWPTEEETFEVEMILESGNVEKMAKLALLLCELKNPDEKNKDNKFKEVHDIIRSLDGEGGVQLYDRFHTLLSESGKFTFEYGETETGKKNKKARKLRKKGRK